VDLGVGRGIRKERGGIPGRRGRGRCGYGAGGADKAAGARNPRGWLRWRGGEAARVRAGLRPEVEGDPDRWGPPVSGGGEGEGGPLCARGEGGRAAVAGPLLGRGGGEEKGLRGVVGRR
jgi:hypothetical protein